MKKAPYILKDLSIYKMPGFPRGLDNFDNLADNINIVAGPNASGKSSTARIIQQLIWHNKTKGLHAEGSVVLDGETWEIKIDSDNIRIQRDGKDDEFIGIPASEGYHRYMLALHELVKENEDDLAREIIKQSIGGYDLDAAKQNLNYSPTIKNKAASQYKDFKESDKKYKEKRNEQKELKKQEENLTQLYDEKESAQHAFKLSQFYEKVADFLQVKQKFDQLSEKYDMFPNSLENITGEEYINIEDFEKQIEDADDIIEQAKKEIKNREKTLENLEIPVDGISDKILTELEERIEKLNEFFRNINDKKGKIEGFQKKELEAIKSIDKSIDPTEWEGLKLEEIGNLDKFLQNAHQLLGEKEFLLAEINALEKATERSGNEYFDSEKLIQGVKTLGYWLKEQTSTIGISRWIIATASVLGIVTAIVTFFAGWPGLLGIFLIAGLLTYAYLFDNKQNKKTTLNIREQDFIKLGLTPLTNWNIENVSNQIEELIENLRDAKEEEKINQRLKNCNDNLDNLQSRLDQINKIRDEWVEKLKAAPGFPETNSNDFSSLYWFLKHAKDWQAAHAELEVLKAQKIKLEDQYIKELEEINDHFIKSNFDKAKDDIEAKAIFKQIKEQESTRKDNVQLIGLKNEQINEQERQKDKATSKLKKIFQKLDVGNGDKETVRQLVGQLDEYKQVIKEHYATKEGLSEKENLLKNHSLYADYKRDIEVLSIDQVQERIEELTNQADKLEGIKEEITRIETLIQSKKKGHELEDILTEKEDALNSLEQLYENNLCSVTGNLIISQLKKETREQNRPKVFKRANEILNKITNGRYELRLEEKEEPTFKAYDTILKLGQDLSEISTGTRVQLLLSIRLAFVETQESSIRLPLLADELLANSDDERAKAIIESLIGISREGRQVFYFTAQADEVSKWDSYLKEQSDLDYKVIQLKGSIKSSFNYADYQPDLNSLTFLQQIPSPNGKSHEDYGKEIGKEPFNNLIQDCSQLPLWYLIEDVDLLYDCLKKGIRYWGQLNSYHRNNGLIQKLNESTWHQINNKIKLLERFQVLYRRGRSRPIDREVLESSAAISGSFIDEVTAKLNELKGNPKELVQTLRNGEISGFRHSKTEELEQFLLSEEYLDYQDTLNKDDIIVQLHAIISNMEMETEDAENFLNRILQNSNDKSTRNI